MTLNALLYYCLGANTRNHETSNRSLLLSSVCSQYTVVLNQICLDIYAVPGINKPMVANCQCWHRNIIFCSGCPEIVHVLLFHVFHVLFGSFLVLPTLPSMPLQHFQTRFSIIKEKFRTNSYAICKKEDAFCVHKKLQGLFRSHQDS